MDREHPIPQEVSTYEFRLVGDMTIKQFMQVAAGALIALVIYSSNVAPYVKWPLIIISFLTGVALAFFPIEDRPLSKWIVLFVKAIYSPTEYVWNKNARKYEFFQAENIELQVPGTSAVPPTPLPNPADPSIANPAIPAEDIKLDKEEEALLQKVDNQFNATTPVPPPVPTPTLPPLQPSALNTPAAQKPMTAESVDSKLSVPAAPAVTIEAAPKPEAAVQAPEMAITTSTGEQVTPLASAPVQAPQSATFSQEASPPSPPTRPNVVVGQILSHDGKILDGAILEIKDQEGRSVRALRSNRLGHFMIVTPLLNGKYTISTEKEGYTFDGISFEATDTIIPPIAIWAKG